MRKEGIEDSWDSELCEGLRECEARINPWLFRKKRKKGSTTLARLMNVGFGNVVNTAKIVAVISPEAAPIKRMVQNAKQLGKVIDATQGRRTKAVIVTEEDHIILSALQPETLVKRFHLNPEDLKGEVDEA